MLNDNEQRLDFSDKLIELREAQRTDGPVAADKKVDDFVRFLQETHNLPPRISEVIGQQLLRAMWDRRDGLTLVLNSRNRENVRFRPEAEFKEGAEEHQWGIYTSGGTGGPVQVHVRQHE